MMGPSGIHICRKPPELPVRYLSRQANLPISFSWVRMACEYNVRTIRRDVEQASKAIEPAGEQGDSLLI
jgi:hypothetical protein